MANGKSRSSMYACLAMMSAGIKANAPAGMTTLPIGGKEMSMADITARLDAEVAPHTEVGEATHARTVALKKRSNAAGGAKLTCKLVRAALKGALGVDNPELLNYGIEPEKEP